MKNHSRNAQIRLFMFINLCTNSVDNKLFDDLLPKC